MIGSAKNIIIAAIVGERKHSPNLAPGVEKLDAWENPLEAEPLAQVIIESLRKAGYQIVPIQNSN